MGQCVVGLEVLLPQCLCHSKAIYQQRLAAFLGWLQHVEGQHSSCTLELSQHPEPQRVPGGDQKLLSV